MSGTFAGYVDIKTLDARSWYAILRGDNITLTLSITPHFVPGLHTFYLIDLLISKLVHELYVTWATYGTCQLWISTDGMQWITRRPKGYSSVQRLPSQLLDR